MNWVVVMMTCTGVYCSDPDVVRSLGTYEEELTARYNQIVDIQSFNDANDTRRVVCTIVLPFHRWESGRPFTSTWTIPHRCPVLKENPDQR